MSRRAALVTVVLLAGVGSTGAADRQLDVPYVAGGGPKQQLDLYVPDGKGFATVLLVHGGSLETGDRKEAPYPALGETFQKAGIACAIPCYRLLEQATWPAQVQDTAAAFAWVKKNIAARGGDPRKIFVAGHSSGARLVALLATDRELLKPHGLTTADIAGSVPLGSLLYDRNGYAQAERMTPQQLQRVFEKDRSLGMHGNLENYKKSWPLAHVGGHMPPMLILIAEEEQIHPPILATAEVFVEAARRAGAARVSFEVLPARTHMSALEKMTAASDPTFQRIVRFIRLGE
jgi:acetyl esterase/lipase